MKIARKEVKLTDNTQINNITYNVCINFAVDGSLQGGSSWSHGDGDVVASPGRPVIDGGSRGAGGRGDAGRTVELCECCGSRHLRMRV